MHKSYGHVSVRPPYPLLGWQQYGDPVNVHPARGAARDADTVPVVTSITPIETAVTITASIPYAGTVGDRRWNGAYKRKARAVTSFTALIKTTRTKKIHQRKDKRVNMAIR